jgi:hypothetical protein
MFNVGVTTSISTTVASRWLLTDHVAAVVMSPLLVDIESDDAFDGTNTAVAALLFLLLLLLLRLTVSIVAVFVDSATGIAVVDDDKLILFDATALEIGAAAACDNVSGSVIVDRVGVDEAFSGVSGASCTVGSNFSSAALSGERPRTSSDRRCAWRARPPAPLLVVVDADDDDMRDGTAPLVAGLAEPRDDADADTDDAECNRGTFLATSSSSLSRRVRGTVSRRSHVAAAAIMSDVGKKENTRRKCTRAQKQRKPKNLLWVVKIWPRRVVSPCGLQRDP